MDSDFATALLSLEEEFDLPKGFLASLLGEGDWSFVIKTHALVEAALSQLLADAVMDPRLIPVFQRLETSNNTTGKIAFAKAMALLPERRYKFIKTLSELRNRLVHDVSQCAFTFGQHLEGLNMSKRREFGIVFSWKVSRRQGAPKDDWDEKAFEDPQRAIWINLLLLLIDTSRKRAEFQDFMDENDVP